MTACRTTLLLAAGVIAASQIVAAAVKVRVDVDKAFDFSQARTWSWAPAPAGHVIVARTPTDDPDAIQRLAEPVVLEAVAAEIPGRGLKQSTDNPDLTLKYYLLLTVGSSAQTVGQFLPASCPMGRAVLPAVHTIAEGDPAGLAGARLQRQGRDRLERCRRSRNQSGAPSGAKGGAHPRGGPRNPEALSSTEIALTAKQTTGIR